MTAFLEEDTERALFRHLREGTTGTGALVGLDELKIPVDLPGERFSPERAGDRWVEPRIVGIRRDSLARPDEEFDRVDVQIRCFVKTLQKGGKFLSLAPLVDLVRNLVDSTRNAAAAKIYTAEQVDAGRLQFGPVSSTRLYDTAVVIKDVVVPGVDVAILTTTMLATGDP